MQRSAILPFMLMAWVICCAVACKKKDEGTTPDAEGNPPVGRVDNQAGFYMRYKTSKKFTYNIHKGDTTFDDECKAEAGQQVDCFLEAEELDLAFHGVTLHYNVPSSMCSYVEFHPYYFYRLPSGVGPALIRIDTGSNGDTGIDADSDGLFTNLVGGDRPAEGVDLNSDGDFVDAGEYPPPPTGCNFDYSQADGPNCCEGTYTKIERQWDSSTTPAGYGQPVVSNNVPWGGKVSACLGGPAMATQTLTKDGFPRADILFVEGVGVNKEYVVEAPIPKGVPTNSYVANFFIPAEHAGGVPGGLFEGYVPATGLWQPLAERYYRVLCMDRAEEIIAEIRLQVREWNTTDDFAARKTAPTEHSKTGSEDTPFGSYPLNDWSDWKDFELQTIFKGYPAYD